MTREQVEQIKKDAFCEGFAYGCRYICENKSHGRMEGSDVLGTWILAERLFNELEEQNEKDE